jgi:hypothetical protein
MKRRRVLQTLGTSLAIFALPGGAARAHHGWSSFDEKAPLYLAGSAKRVKWQNPHAELLLAVPADLKLPADLASRSLPAQSAAVDGPAILKATRLPQRLGADWEVELAPLSRMSAWQIAEIKPGTQVAVIGYTSPGEKGERVLRAEYLFVDGKTYGLRSSPA